MNDEAVPSVAAAGAGPAAVDATRTRRRPVDPDPIARAPLSDRVRALARRGFGKSAFIPIRDRSGDLQLFLSLNDTERFAETLEHFDIGDIVGAEGVIFWTKTGEMSLQVRRLVVITKAVRPLPDKFHGLTDVEQRYRQRYVDLAIDPAVREVFSKRSRLVAGIRRFLDARAFLEAEGISFATVHDGEQRLVAREARAGGGAWNGERVSADDPSLAKRRKIHDEILDLLAFLESGGKPDAPHFRKMRLQLSLRLVQVNDGCARQFELPRRLQRNRGTILLQPDDVAAVEDRFPTQLGQ